MKRLAMALMMTVLISGCSQDRSSGGSGKDTKPSPKPRPIDCRARGTCEDGLRNLAPEDFKSLHDQVISTLAKQELKSDLPAPARILMTSAVLASELSKLFPEVGTPDEKSYVTVYQHFFGTDGQILRSVDFEKLWRDL